LQAEIAEREHEYEQAQALHGGSFDQEPDLAKAKVRLAEITSQLESEVDQASDRDGGGTSQPAAERPGPTQSASAAHMAQVTFSGSDRSRGAASNGQRAS